MSNYILAAIVAFILMTSPSLSQKNTYIGAEVGRVYDKYELVDNGNELKTPFLINGLWGFNIRQDIYDWLYLEVAILRKYYNMGIAFKTVGNAGSSRAITAWLLPIRLGTRVNIHKNKIFLVPVIGYSYSINSDFGGYGTTSGGIQFRGDSVRYSYSSKFDFSKNFPLLQTGMGMEVNILKSALLSLSANYYTGFKRVIQQDIKYRVNTSYEQTATLFSKGETLSIEVGIKFPLGGR